MKERSPIFPLFLSKEISWIAFNERVLQEAQDKRNPLIERVRFLGIYSNNLDEFYKVQYANLKKNVLIEEAQKKESHLKHSVLKKELTRQIKTTKQVLKQVDNKIQQDDELFESLYNDLLLEMSRHQLFLINERQLSLTQEIWIHEFFKTELKQYIIPILLTPYTDLIQILKDDHTYLAVEIIEKNTTHYALIDLPTDKVGRFITLPAEVYSKNRSIIFLDNIIRFCLPTIFYHFFDGEYNAYSIKFNRDAEYELNYEQDSLLELMSQGLKQRLTAQPVRFSYQKELPQPLLHLLLEKLKLTEADSTVGGRYPNLKDLMSFPYEGRKQLLYQNKPPIKQHLFNQFKNYFDAIATQDVLLYYPYHSFLYLLEMMRQASFDPAVTEIKINIYRVSKQSKFMQAAINAAHNGKKVTVVIELQARFDEENNIKWAKRLIQAGVKVIYSMPKFKIHAKLFLITRLENNGLKRYAHIGTGNFNEKTAQIYTDFSLLTADTTITNEVHKVFKFIENPFKPVHFEHLLVSPQNMRERLNALIDREIIHARTAKKAKIMLKVNALTDPELIAKLYEASNAGVIVKLLVRGACTLMPNQLNLSENIQVFSLVDRYLEHARVYVFENDGNQDVFISSADWMPRNIDNRVEVGVKIREERLKSMVLTILKLQFQDTVKNRIINKDLNNRYVERGNRRKIRAQFAIYDYLSQLEAQNRINLNEQSINNQ